MSLRFSRGVLRVLVGLSPFAPVGMIVVRADEEIAAQLALAASAKRGKASLADILYYTAWPGWGRDIATSEAEKTVIVYFWAPGMRATATQPMIRLGKRGRGKAWVL